MEIKNFMLCFFKTEETERAMSALAETNSQKLSMNGRLETMTQQRGRYLNELNSARRKSCFTHEQTYICMYLIVSHYIST